MPPRPRTIVQDLVKRGGKVEERFDNLTTKRGKQNAATVVNAQSKLIRLEETGAGGAVGQAGTGTASSSPAAGSGAPAQLSPDDYVGDSADRTGFGGLEAIDPITMVAVPDLMAAYQQGTIDLEGVQAVQLAMIAHCELMGDRVAILDPPPGLNAQQIHEWRIDKAGYDSKYAALYWPWVKVFDPAAGAEHLRARRAATWPGIWSRNDDTRGVHKAPANEVVRGAITLELQHHQERARPAQPARHQLHPGVPGAGHPGVGRPHPVERPGVALPQRPPALQLPRGVDPRRHPVGRLRAERPRAVGQDPPHDQRVPGHGVAQGRAVRPHARARPSTSSATTRRTRPRASTLGQVVCEIGIAPVKPAEFVIFRLSQYSGGASLIE